MDTREAKRSPAPRLVYSRQFSLTSVGSGKSEEQIQRDVNDARLEAIRDYVAEVVQIERGQGFLAGGLESLWLFALLPGVKAAGLGFAGALGKKAGDKLYELFEERLRERNLLPKAVSGARRGTRQTARGSRSARRSKSGRKS